MAQISESRGVSDSAAEHVADHNEVHRKVNRLVVTASTVTDNIVVSDPDVDNAIASDVNSCTLIGGGQSGRENIIGGDGSSTVDTTTPNETSAGTGANLSTIMGGYDNVAGGLASYIGGAHNYTAIGTNHGVIAGGSSNKITGTAAFGTITGGKSNEVSDTYGSVTGGFGNVASDNSATVGGGKSNTASGQYSAVTGGEDNTSSGGWSTVPGGDTNEASGEYSTATGYFNTASGDKSSVIGGDGNEAAGVNSVAMGHEAVAGQRDGFTIGGGKIAAAGDAQSTTMVIRRQTTNASATELRPEDFYRVTIPSDTTWAFRALIVARRTDADNESAAYELLGCIDNNAGTTALVGSVSKTVIAEDTAAWDVSATADNTNDALSIKATGEASKTINWVCRLDIAEVTG